MIKLRSAGAASILTLLLVLALFTTGAFAQSVQMSKIHTAVATHIAPVARVRLGGGPLPVVPPPPAAPPVTAAPVMPAAPAAPVVHKAAPVVSHPHAAAIAVAHSSNCIPFDGFWGGTSILNGCGGLGFGGGFGSGFGFNNFGGFGLGDFGCGNFF